MKRIVNFIILFIIYYPFFISCKKSVVDEDKLPEKQRIPVSQFESLWSNAHEKESFLFFTDPHLLSSNNNFTDKVRSNLKESFTKAKELYDNLPLSFCLCGGDWLNSGDTQEMAQQKLLFADNTMKEMFDNYYKIFGNHDTNYQGVISEDNKNNGNLLRSFIDNEFYSETGSAYYTFKTNNSEFFILNSGIDWNIKIDDYRLEQLIWLGEQLNNSLTAHKIIGIHMFYSVTPTLLPMSEEIASICKAFNSREKYTFSNKEYDFSAAQGTIHLILTGHRHTDFIEDVNGIPVVGTTQFLINGTPTFDLYILDYDTGYANLIRVGVGNNRRVKMYM